MQLIEELSTSSTLAAIASDRSCPNSNPSCSRRVDKPDSPSLDGLSRRRRLPRHCEGASTR